MELTKYTSWILYEPLGSEPDPATFLKHIGAKPKIIYTVPKARGADPFEYAQLLTSALGGEAAAVLLPGTEFDALGTRHGRGGGWYDRFLSKVPADWIRIGLATEHIFSKQKLVRQAHDEAVDWVAVCNKDKWPLYDTNARQAILSK